MSSKGPSAWLFVLLALVAVAAAWFLLLAPGPTKRERKTAPPPPGPATRTEPTKGPPRTWTPRDPPKPAPVAEGCEPRASRACIRGDAWFVDSCGVPHEQADDCTLAGCEDGACMTPDLRCGTEDGLPRCEGERAVGCAAGRHFDVDCAALGRSCVMAEEGPACRKLAGPTCDKRTHQLRCEGTELVACREGVEVRVDCEDVGAACMPTRGGGSFGCVQDGATRPTADTCGPCGCEPDPSAEETCDGQDNDGDGLIDENASCPVVDLVALVIADSDGSTSYTDADFEIELERLNRTYAREDDLGLTFRWADIVYVDAPSLREVDDDELDQALRQSSVVTREDAFVPIVFTDELLVDGIPRPGLSTAPNGMCGGHRRVRGPQPLLGGIVIAKQRWPTTVAHEVGHFLGLCHTHGDSFDAVVIADGAQSCTPDCSVEGDGICDTPLDPGPPQCSADPACEIYCGDGSRPQVENIMGYYPDCRRAFSAEQARTMRQAWALRRGWHRCLETGKCGCKPGLKQCPEAMTCTPFGQAPDFDWQCRLDGSRPAKARCDTASDCAGSVCLSTPQGQSACVRLCDPEQPDCRCRVLPGAPAPLCEDDLAPS